MDNSVDNLTEMLNVSNISNVCGPFNTSLNDEEKSNEFNLLNYLHNYLENILNYSIQFREFEFNTYVKQNIFKYKNIFENILNNYYTDREFYNEHLEIYGLLCLYINSFEILDNEQKINKAYEIISRIFELLDKIESYKDSEKTC